jgi:hypothetical protein
MSNYIVEKAFDNDDNAFKTIDIVHDHVHDGRMFSVSYKPADGSPIADNADITFGISVGARFPHMFWGSSVGGEAEIMAYMGSAFSGGTSLSRFNMNHNQNLFIPTTSFVLAPSISGAGTLFSNYMLPGGAGAGGSVTRVGGSARDQTEWILKVNTKYLIRLFNRSGGAIYMSLIVTFYETDYEVG